MHPMCSKLDGVSGLRGFILQVVTMWQGQMLEWELRIVGGFAWGFAVSPSKFGNLARGCVASGACKHRQLPRRPLRWKK